MKKLAFILGAGLLSLAFAASSGLKIGTAAPMADHKMMDISETKMSLNDLKKDNGLLVVFSCNTCPWVIAWEDTYPELAKMAKENNIGMVLVNSNAAKREGDDSLGKMQVHYKKAGYTSRYVVDKDSKLANAFGAKTTPHVFLFNGKMELAYKGAINNKFDTREEIPTQFYVKDAMQQIAKGEEVALNSTQEKGCSIKRVKR